MPFTFTLAAVLKLREGIEEREQRKLELLHHEIMHAQQLVERFDAQLQETARMREQALQQVLAAFHLHALEDARRAIQRRKEEVLAQLVGLKGDREKQLRVFEAARRDRKVLSEMRDHQLEAYRAASSRRQQRAIDDLFGARQSRK